MFGFGNRNMPFFGTPKKVESNAFWYALQSAREEGLVMMAILLAAHGIFYQQGSETPDVLVWIIVLLVQAIPYLAAVIMSIVGAFAQLPAKRLIDKIIAPPEAPFTIGKADHIKNP